MLEFRFWIWLFSLLCVVSMIMGVWWLVWWKCVSSVILLMFGRLRLRIMSLWWFCVSVCLVKMLLCIMLMVKLVCLRLFWILCVMGWLFLIRRSCMKFV